MDERHFLPMTLAYLASFNAIVLDGTLQALSAEIQIAEARCGYGFQIMKNNIHSETYSAFLKSWVGEEREMTALVDMTQNSTQARRKARWAQKWIKDVTAPFQHRQLAFVILERVFSSGSVAALSFTESCGFLMELSRVNALVHNDHMKHTAFAATVLNCFEERPTAPFVEALVREAVDIEKEAVNSKYRIAMLKDTRS